MYKILESLIAKIPFLNSKKDDTKSNIELEYIDDEDDDFISGEMYFNYKGINYWLFAGMDSYTYLKSSLFDPTLFDMNPQSYVIDGYDGHFCKFYIKDKLYLTRVRIRCDRPKPTLFGKKCVMDNEGYANYNELNHVIKYTGSGYFGFGSNNKYVFSDGGVKRFYPAWCFEKVVELQFSRGELINIIDHSDRMQRIRELLPKDVNSPEYIKLSTQPYLEELLTNYDIKYLGELHWIIKTGRPKWLYLEELKRLKLFGKI